MPQSIYFPALATSILSLATQGSGVSAEAGVIQNDLCHVIGHHETSESIFGAKSKLISELREIASECSDSNWDGYGAKGISEAVLIRAETFIRALPDSIPAPEISAEPDGQISFDWLPSRTRTFTLSVGSNTRLAYAWIDGANRGNAAVSYDGAALPERLLRELKYLTANDATVRTS